MEEQGYEAKDNIVYQDKKSKMPLDKNGEASRGNRTKHINNRYFFVTDKLAKKDISMEYFPTADMYGDFYTNTTQGRLYNTQWQAIINLQSNDTNYYVPEGYKPSVSQECVGGNNYNRNEVAAAQTGNLKYVRRYSNMLT